MANRLAQESSPYLLQHANNPVDWYPWGEEAFARARAEDKPIFLSIGYSACHWCHVMEHESFESPAIAKLLNAGYVSIKVDREERPDLDQIYMNAVQLLTGRGGWPMSVFLTHQGEPFFGGTYWPPHPKLGMPGFDQILKAVSDAWHQRRPELLTQANKITAHLSATPQEEPRPVPEHVLETAVAKLEQVFDFQNGGFGGAPKFPHPMDLQVLLRYWRVQPKADLERMVALTLDKMARGGIYDQLGGGFHRYSVDEAWLVPHFEKMLYDNALLTTACLEAYQALGKPQLTRVVRETLDYVLREMTDPAGGFYSTQDADSEGEEGKFYVWSQAEVEQLLGPQPAETFCYVYDVSPAGNFEGQNILNMPKTLDQCANILQRDVDELAVELAANRQVLLAARNERVWPGLDDKVLVSWNGLMIAAMARGGAILQEPRYLQAATRAAEFITTNMRGPQGELLHSWRQGKARFAAYLDDYACLASALVALYEATFDERWIDEAVSLCEVLLAQFQDQEHGGFFFTADNHEQLITRNKDVMDASVPSGNAMAATALVQLGYLCGRTDFLEAAERTFQSLATVMQQSPTAVGQLLLAWDNFRGPTEQFVLVGDTTSEQFDSVLAALRQAYLPSAVVACRTNAETPAESSASGQLSPQLSAAFAGRKPHDGQPTLYICRGFVCDEPLVGAQAILDKLASLATPRA